MDLQILQDLIWKSENEITVSKDKADTLFKLLNILEENEDVQAVSSNFDVSDDVLDFFNSIAKGKLCLIKLGKKEREMLQIILMVKEHL